jgi:predicted CoA-binding protein
MEKGKFINSFFEQKRIALAGVSRDNKKIWQICIQKLTKKGYSIAPINKNTDEIDGVKCYKNFEELTEKFDSALISVKPTETLSAIKSAVNAGIKNIWIQQGSESEDAIKYCQTNIFLLFQMNVL